MEPYSVQKYHDCFDGKLYAHLYFSLDVDYELKTYPEDFLHRMFAEGKLPGKDLLDVGCGPTVRCAISASKFIADIYLSDLVESNRKEVVKWLNKEADAIDYTWQFQFVAHLERVSDHHVVEERTRQAIRDVIPCNILDSSPLHPRVDLQFDVVTSSFCIDCFTDDQDCKLALKRMAALLRPSGRLALLGILSTVDNPGLPGAESVKQMLKETGFQILVFEERYIENGKTVIPNLAGEFGVICRKIQ